MRILSFGTLATAACTIIAAAPAHAQDGGAPFTGPHVEGVVGWDNFSAGSRESTSRDSVVWGGAVGYDYQTGGIVIGGDIELTGSGVSASVDNYSIPTDNLRVEADRDFYVGLRLGAVISPQLLGYVKLGYTNLRLEATYEPGVAGQPIIEDASNADGIRAGLGLEYRFAQGFYAKGEYRYSNYGDVRDWEIDTDRNQIVVGVGYRF